MHKKMDDAQKTKTSVSSVLLEGKVEYLGKPLTFVFERGTEELFFRCLDVGRIFDDRNMKRGRKTKKYFNAISGRKCFSNMEDTFHVVVKRAKNTEDAKLFVSWVREMFFNSQMREYLIESEGREILLRITRNIGEIFIDGEESKSFEGAKKDYPGLFGTLELAEKLLLTREKNFVGNRGEGKKEFVYILKDISGTSEMFKVGKTKDIKKRLGGYSCGSSQRPKFEKTFETENCDLFERCMHYVFSESRKGATEMFEAPLSALKLVGDIVGMLDELKALNREYASPFSEEKYTAMCSDILKSRKAVRANEERKDTHKRDKKLKEEKLRLVASFVEQHGRFPTKGESLNEFLVSFKARYRQKAKMKFNRELVDIAESIPGWTWEIPPQDSFEKLYGELSAWLDENKVRLTRKKNVTLYDNLNSWKKAYRKYPNEREDERLKLISLFSEHDVPFDVVPQESDFLNRVEELREYMAKNKGKLPPTRTELGDWLVEQRKHFNKKRVMDPEKKALLDSVYPLWSLSPNGLAWEKNVLEEANYYAKHGHFTPKRIDAFLSNQRLHLKRTKTLKNPKAQERLESRIAFLDKHLPGWDEVRGGKNTTKGCPVCDEEIQEQ
uniref:Helicase n=1 Tax=Marseillevirus sp. TaxID=2809551 RepID=A0AA96J2W6_9VIRU|nr:helicase [Marseillevirus sp.]